MSGSADFNAGWREGQRALRAWLDAHPRYDIPAEHGGCIIVLDLRDLDREFPEVVCAAPRRQHSPSPSPVPPSGESRTPCADGPCTLSSPGCAGPSLQETEQ